MYSRSRSVSPNKRHMVSDATIDEDIIFAEHVEELQQAMSRLEDAPPSSSASEGGDDLEKDLESGFHAILHGGIGGARGIDLVATECLGACRTLALGEIGASEEAWHRRVAPVALPLPALSSDAGRAVATGHGPRLRIDDHVACTAQV